MTDRQSRSRWITSAGDPAGSSPELIPSLLQNLNEGETLVITGPVTVRDKVCPELEITTEPFAQKTNCWYPAGKINSRDILSGRPNQNSGEAALDSLDGALELLRSDSAEALITLPLSKKAVRSAGNLEFTGHTEYLEEFFGRRGLMSFFGREFNCSLLTRHIPLDRVAESITVNLIVEKVKLCAKFFRRAKINSPRFALLGLNPHAGEEGSLGEEEINILRPAVEKLKKNNINITGPHPADSFLPVEAKNTDMIFSCYHDQGLSAFKLLHFFDGVHVTLGLGVQRVSPVHGTAAALAGSGKINPRSALNCLSWLRKWAGNN